MLKDFDMIIHKLPEHIDELRIYPLGDLHVGSPEFDEPFFKSWCHVVADDPLGYIVIAGDLLNNGLKNSKTNSYEETMPPSVQKEYLHEALEPLADKLLCATEGNHERRSGRESDGQPLYDVMCWLRKQHLYRNRCCFMKINLGRKYNQKPCSYGVVVTHGGSANAVKAFGASIDGCDLLICGHTHTGEALPTSKIFIDMRNEMVTQVPYRIVRCTSFLNYGGYAIEKTYAPQSYRELQVTTLSGREKATEYKGKHMQV